MLLVMVILNPNRVAGIRNDHALWVKKNTNAVKQIIPKLMGYEHYRRNGFISRHGMSPEK